jgi:hypothetical protein
MTKINAAVMSFAYRPPQASHKKKEGRRVVSRDVV